MPRKPRTPAPSAPLPDAVTLAEATADVDALFGVQPEAADPHGIDAWDAAHPGPGPVDAQVTAYEVATDGERSCGSIEDRVARVIRDARGQTLTPEQEAELLRQIDAHGPYVVRANPLDYLTPAECHAVYRAVQSGRIRVAEWTGRTLQTVTGSLIGNVYALPNGGYAGRTGGRIEEFGTESEARTAVEGHAAEAGWTVTR